MEGSYFQFKKRSIKWKEKNVNMVILFYSCPSSNEGDNSHSTWVSESWTGCVGEGIIPCIHSFKNQLSLNSRYMRTICEYTVFKIQFLSV